MAPRSTISASMRALRTDFRDAGALAFGGFSRACSSARSPSERPTRRFSVRQSPLHAPLNPTRRRPAAQLTSRRVPRTLFGEAGIPTFLRFSRAGRTPPWPRSAQPLNPPRSPEAASPEREPQLPVRAQLGARRRSRLRAPRVLPHTLVSPRRATTVSGDMVGPWAPTTLATHARSLARAGFSWGARRRRRRPRPSASPSAQRSRGGRTS